MHRDYDYYLILGRVVQIVYSRDSHQRIVPDPARGDYLATLRDVPGRSSVLVRKSHLLTENLLSQILLMREGRWNEFNSESNIDLQIPENLVEAFVLKIKAAARDVSLQYKVLGQEPLMVGAFFSRLMGKYSAGSWELDVHYQSFSPIVKENHLGADVGMVLDMATQTGGRLIKAVWFQAKRSDSIPVDLNMLEGLEGQMEDMESHTTAGHALVFSPSRIVAASSRELRSPKPVQDVLRETLRCHRGDRRPIVLANSFDMKNVVEIIISKNRTCR